MEGEETDALRKRRLVEAAALEALDERKKDSSLKTTSSTAVSERTLRANEMRQPENGQLPRGTKGKDSAMTPRHKEFSQKRNSDEGLRLR